MKNTYLLVLLLFTACFISCDEKEEEVVGCTDSLSYNFNPEAYTDDGSCSYYYGGREMGQIDVGPTVDLNNEYNVYIDNEFIGRVTHYFPNGLECGNPNSVGRIFEAGSHVVRVEGNGGSDIREGIVNLSPQECLVVILQDLPLAGGGGGGGNGSGNAIFWTNSDLGCGPITVNVSGVGSSTINGFFGSAPSCSNSSAGGNFNNLAPGVYNFTASCSNENWSGSISITENGCLRQELTSSGGGNTTGDLIFWTNHDFGCGPITVNLNGVGSTTITSYFGSAPNCSNTSGGGNFNNLSPGNYSFSASCSNLTWNGNLTVTQNSCLRFQLN